MFYREQAIKAVRKARRCDGCGQRLIIGEPALSCVGVGNDGFWSAVYHTDCRKAEIGLNDLYDFRGGDDWMPLGDMDVDDWPWLIEQFPTVAVRFNVTTERYEAARSRKFWNACNAKRAAQGTSASGRDPQGHEAKPAGDAPHD